MGSSSNILSQFLRPSSVPIMVSILFSVPLFCFSMSKLQELGEADRSLSLRRQLEIVPYKQDFLEPVSCSDIIQSANYSDEYENKMYLRYTNTDPRFWISLHTKDYDKTRWAIFDHGKYYEQAQTKSFVEILNSTGASKRVIDVGGNVGWFSLVSAAMGATVDVFEPNRMNYLRMCESICMNNFGACDTSFGHRDIAEFKEKENGMVNVFPIGIGSEIGEALFHPNDWNPGMGSIIDERRAEQLEAKSKTVNRIRVMPLDEMAQQQDWYREIIDILKIDVEGFELEVFEGASNLLKSNSVRNIFMEGDVSSRTSRQQIEHLADVLTGYGYTLHKIGGFSGPTDLVTLPINDLFAESVADLCRNGGRKPRNKCNLWWKLSEQQ